MEFQPRVIADVRAATMEAVVAALQDAWVEAWEKYEAYEKVARDASIAATRTRTLCENLHKILDQIDALGRTF